MTNPIRRILAASDLSERADHALARAARLAGEHGAALTALSVVEPQAPGGAEDWLWPQGALPADLEAQVLAETRAQLAARPGALGARVVVRAGKPFVEIIQEARADGAELIALGAHGGHYLQDLLLGTTAERVVRKSDRPVLVVKREPHSGYARVLVPLDFSEPAREALALAARAAPQARFTLLHAYDIWYEGRLRTGGMTDEAIAQLHRDYAQQARGRMRTLARDAGLDVDDADCLVRHGYPPTVIVQALRERDADLAVLGSHGRSGLRYVLLGSVAEHVLRESPCDVLVVHPKIAGFELP
ncbi:MAG TPA: universal stress protein [Acidiferrobacterales bacterium]